MLTAFQNKLHCLHACTQKDQPWMSYDSENEKKKTNVSKKEEKRQQQKKRLALWGGWIVFQMHKYSMHMNQREMAATSG